jgi:chitin synthase
VTLTLNLEGVLTGASLALSQSGIDTKKGLLNIPSESGYRAFDVFYYLLTSASTPAEREFLGLKHPSQYGLLARSGTYDPPSYLPTADDSAAAEDFRASLKQIGIKGSSYRNLISVLIGILKLGDTLNFDVDSDGLEEICEDVGGLLGLDPDVLAKQCSTDEREVLIGGLYEAIVDWVLSKANEAIASELLGIKNADNSSDGARTPNTDEDNGDTVCITVLEIPSPNLGKAVALRGVFDDSQGINVEMKEDGIEVVTAGSSVLREMENATFDVGPELGIMSGPLGREREFEQDRRESVLEKVGREAENDSFIKGVLFPVQGEGVRLGSVGRLDMPAVLGSSRVWHHLSLYPTDDAPASLASLPTLTSAWSAGTVSRQLRAWRLPEWANRRNKNLDFTADFDHDEFVQRYSSLGCKDGKDGIESWILERGWSNGEVIIGKERVWMRESAWWEAESMLDMKPSMPQDDYGDLGGLLDQGAVQTGYSAGDPNASGFFQPSIDLRHQDSRDGLMADGGNGGAKSVFGAQSKAPTQAIGGGDYGLGYKGDKLEGQVYYNDELGQFVSGLDPEVGQPHHLITEPTTFGRRIWVMFVWALTFWIPSFVLRYIGRMKRPDVRMAWREKLVLVFLIFLLNGIVVFYIVGFGRLLCPNFDKVWDAKNVGTHQGDDDFYVSIHGKVYDISKFWRQDHGTSRNPVQAGYMDEIRGKNLDIYFMPPLNVYCPDLVQDDTVYVTSNDTSMAFVDHISGTRQPDPTSEMAADDWYTSKFLLKMKEYYKGDLVIKDQDVANDGRINQHQWFKLNEKFYDLENYFYTLKLRDGYPGFNYLDETLTDIVKAHPGEDITELWDAKYAKASRSKQEVLKQNLACLDQVFFIGKPDFRYSARCQVNNYILLAFTCMLCAVILVKFLAALQFGSKKRPSMQDKFVICQVPAYTEGEESLRKALDSLTALQYDNKRKLIVVICDGMIVGGGNDRPTPKIVLDILGVDPKIDPPALPFHSVGQSSEQLNYGKVYSGLYEFEGNVVPYLVVVKVGKESEQTKSKPGNRGKRDSQILLMSFLNRVHHRSPMNPLELEMFHQINNIIGVDPELYEYLFMVDADTSVREDSLNRLVAACANDAKIAGICGETSLENEEKSWWTMIQVYEYFISHHLAKAFESLFGSVTCLPGW